MGRREDRRTPSITIEDLDCVFAKQQHFAQFVITNPKIEATVKFKKFSLTLAPIRHAYDFFPYITARAKKE